jgi:hypothetical protein
VAWRQSATQCVRLENYFLNIVVYNFVFLVSTFFPIYFPFLILQFLFILFVSSCLSPPWFRSLCSSSSPPYFSSASSFFQEPG